MRTQHYTASSLDGFIATEDDSLELLFPLTDLNDSSYPNFIAETGAPWPYTQPVWEFTSQVLPVIEGSEIRFVKGDVHQKSGQRPQSSLRTQRTSGLTPTPDLPAGRFSPQPAHPPWHASRRQAVSKEHRQISPAISG